MTLERAGRWWPGREMAMLRREARERWRKGVGRWPRWQ